MNSLRDKKGASGTLMLLTPQATHQVTPQAEGSINKHRGGDTKNATLNATRNYPKSYPEVVNMRINLQP
jgi:hypothetical protein